MTQSAAAQPSLKIDFTSASALRRLAAFRHGRGLVQRACALKNHGTLRVFDATAGCANDSIAMALMGAQVTMAERCLQVAAALSRAMEEVRCSGPVWLKQALDRIRLVPADSIEYLRALNPVSCPDVVIIDPMFPDAGRSARSKKQLEALRMLCGDDLDAPLLLRTARERALHKVVVKRRLKAPPLTEEPPSYILKATTIRYDIYVTVKNPSQPA